MFKYILRYIVGSTGTILYFRRYMAQLFSVKHAVCCGMYLEQSRVDNSITGRNWEQFVQLA